MAQTDLVQGKRVTPRERIVLDKLSPMDQLILAQMVCRYINQERGSGSMDPVSRKKSRME